MDKTNQGLTCFQLKIVPFFSGRTSKIGIIIFAALIYLDSLSDYFISDDFSIILASQQINNFLSFFSPSNNPNWHYSPIPLIIYYLEYTFWGLNSFLWHGITLSFHIANSFLVYLIATRICKNNTTGLIAGLLFASYSLSYEVVIWISGIHTSSMVFFYLLSVLTFLKFHEKGNIFYYLLSLIFSVFSFLSKEESITLIVMIPLYSLLFSCKSSLKNNSWKDSLWKETKKCIPFFIVTLIFILIADRGTFAPHKIKNIFHFYHNSLLMLFIPNQFNIVSNLITTKNYPLIFSLFSGVLIFLLSSVEARFFILWAFITLLPTQIFSGVAARYLYLPCVGSSIFFAVLIYNASLKIPKWLLMKRLLDKKGIVTVDTLKKNFTLLLMILFLSIIIIPGILFINNRKEEWNQSSKIVRNIISTVELTFPAVLPEKNGTILS